MPQFEQQEQATQLSEMSKSKGTQMTVSLNMGVDGNAIGASIPLVRKGVVYADHAGEELRGDFYAPAGPGPFPVVVAAPGGGWFVSDPGGLRHWGEFLARHGIAVFAIQYRVSAKEKTFPKPVFDVLDAIQFVRGSASELSIDPNRIALLGSSAGAHVAALAALAGDTPQFAKRESSNAHPGVDTGVKAFVGVYGVYDLFAHWQHEIADFSSAGGRRSECFLGGAPYTDRQLYFDASPISHVRYEANKLAVFLAHGNADDVVNSRSQSVPFGRALRQAGFAVRECPVEGAGHFWFSEEPLDEPHSFVSFLAPRLLRFLQRHL
jgi:acetyl esterase/lipase